MAAKDVANEVQNRVPLAPVEIGVGHLACAIPQVKQESRYCIRHSGTFSPKDLITSYLDSANMEVGRKLTSIGNVYFQKQDAVFRRDAVVFPLLLLALRIFSLITTHRLIGDDAERLAFSEFVQKSLGLRVKRDLPRS